MYDHSVLFFFSLSRVAERAQIGVGKSFMRLNYQDAYECEVFFYSICLDILLKSHNRFKSDELVSGKNDKMCFGCEINLTIGRWKNLEVLQCIHQSKEEFHSSQCCKLLIDQ